MLHRLFISLSAHALPPPHFNCMLMTINIGAICIYSYCFCISCFHSTWQSSPSWSVQWLRILGQSTSVTTPPLLAQDDCVTIRAGLPPVLDKIVSRIEAGEYIDMTELPPDRLGTTKSPVNNDSLKAGRQRRRALSGILEWVQCFITYMAVYCQKQSHRIQDLLDYQTLIVEALLEYQGDGWLGYAVPTKSCSQSYFSLD